MTLVEKIYTCDNYDIYKKIDETGERWFIKHKNEKEKEANYASFMENNNVILNFGSEEYTVQLKLMPKAFILTPLKVLITLKPLFNRLFIIIYFNFITHCWCTTFITY